jgi:CheY-like chemotaxis protein
MNKDQLKKLTKKINVLFVDDNPQQIKIIKLYLAGGNYNMIAADSLTQAYEVLAGTEEVDVILLDLNLVGESQGLDTFISMAEYALGVPIVILTGTDDHDLWLEAMSKGAQGYLEKHRVTEGYVIESKIKDAVILKATELELIRQRDLARQKEKEAMEAMAQLEIERDRWKNFIDRYWYFVVALFAGAREVGQSESAYNKVMTALDHGKSYLEAIGEAEVEELVWGDGGRQWYEDGTIPDEEEVDNGIL